MPELNDTDMFKNLNLTQTYLREIIQVELSKLINSSANSELVKKAFLLYVQPKLDELRDSITDLGPEKFITSQDVEGHKLITILSDGSRFDTDMSELFNGAVTNQELQGQELISTLTDGTVIKLNLAKLFGDLTTLKTNDKTSLVKAINEIKDETKGVVDLYEKNVIAGADANGWTDLLIITSNGRTQSDKNNDTLSILDYFTKQERDAYFASPTTFDATSQIQKAFNGISGKTLDFLGLSFAINTATFLTDKSKFIIKNGSIKALSTMPSVSGNQLIELNRCTQYAFHNFTVDGNRQQRTAIEAVVHNIFIKSCDYYVFYNVKSINAICDGLYTITNTPFTTEQITGNAIFINSLFDNSVRNNVSIIASKNMMFENCTFTNANGISPQAGVDIESNNYGVADVNSNIAFNNCTFKSNWGWQLSVINFDAPKNIRVNGGVITSNTGKNSSTTSGGVHIFNADTVLDNVLFTNFTANSGYCVRIGAEAKAAAILNKCRFIDNATDTIFTHSISDGIIVDNCYFSNTGNVQLSSNTRNDVRQSKFYDITTANAIVSGDNNAAIVIDDNVMVRANTRAIYASAKNAIVTNNKIYDVATPSYYIQADGVGAIVDNNYCYSSTALNSQQAIRFNKETGTRMMYNECVNLSTTDPYNLQGTVTNALIAYNAGGTVHNRLKQFTPPVIQSSWKATLPSAASLQNGTQMYVNDGNVAAVATVYAGDWYANGKSISQQDVTFSGTRTLPAVANNAQASLDVTVTGAVVGQDVQIGFAASLAGTFVWGEVVAADTVRIYRRNTSGTDATTVSGALKLRCQYV